MLGKCTAKRNGSAKPSLMGLLAVFAIGFGLFFLMNSVQNVTSWLAYDDIVTSIGNGSVRAQLIWILMNFTEADFYAGVLSSALLLAGAFAAWYLDQKGSKLAGIRICYGSNLFPWVLASQLLSMVIGVLILGYTDSFKNGAYGWLPTFIPIVNAPPAVILTFGPSVAALLAGSILGAIISFPVAFWMMTTIVGPWGLPGVVGNVATMAIVGTIVVSVCHALPFVKKVESRQPATVLNTPPLSEEAKLAEMSGPLWFIRRTFADFSEAQFYGNEIAGCMVVLGAVLEWFLNMKHGTYGSGAVPGILLSQFVGAGVGIYLYFHKWLSKGWYATYVPVVSVGPACVLMFGGTVPVAVFSGVMGGILGPAFAEYLIDRLPKDYPPTIANVTSMAITTAFVAFTIKALSVFFQ